MRLVLLHSLAVIAFLGGCASAPASPPAPPPPPAPVALVPAAPSRPAFLAIGTEIRVTRAGALIATLYPNGLLVVAGSSFPRGTLHADGRFVDLAGKEVCAMDPDGRIELGGATITIAEDGTATAEELGGRAQPPLRIDEEGRVSGAGEEMRIAGVTPQTRRTAMFVLLLPDITRMRETAIVR